MLERCISRQRSGSMIPVMYGNNYQIVQQPGYIVITYEIVHEARVIPLDGGRTSVLVRAHMGDPRGRWDGNYARRRDHQLHERVRLSQRQRRHVPRHRTLHACGTGSHRVDRDARRSEDVDQAVDDRHAAHRRSESDLSRSSATSTTTDSETFSARHERLNEIGKVPGSKFQRSVRVNSEPGTSGLAFDSRRAYRHRRDILRRPLAR